MAAGLWSALDRQRAQYRTLAAWLDLCLRWALFCTLMGYGWSKVFLLQMPRDEGALVQPFGTMSGMGLLWSFMGQSDLYQALGGWAEVIGGVMLLWRPTAGLGALLLLGVLGNVYSEAAPDIR